MCVKGVEGGVGVASLLHVTLQQENDGRVALCRLLELLQRYLVIVVLIHFAEDLVYPLLRCEAVLVHLHHDHGAHHFVDRLRVRGSEKLTEECALLSNKAKPTCFQKQPQLLRINVCRSLTSDVTAQPEDIFNSFNPR